MGYELWKNARKVAGAIYFWKNYAAGGTNPLDSAYILLMFALPAAVAGENEPVAVQTTARASELHNLLHLYSSFPHPAGPAKY
jgi:hypothetical protein